MPCKSLQLQRMLFAVLEFLNKAPSNGVCMKGLWYGDNQWIISFKHIYIFFVNNFYKHSFINIEDHRIYCYEIKWLKIREGRSQQKETGERVDIFFCLACQYPKHGNAPAAINTLLPLFLEVYSQWLATIKHLMNLA